MTTVRGLILVAGLLSTAGTLQAADLSLYRQFHLDSDLSGVAQQALMRAEQAVTLYSRPDMIQELT